MLDWVICVHYAYKNSVPTSWYISVIKDYNWPLSVRNVQGDSVARRPKLLSVYTVEQRGFLVRKYWQTGSFKSRQMAFRTEFGERRAPSKCCIQKLVKS